MFPVPYTSLKPFTCQEAETDCASCCSRDNCCWRGRELPSYQQSPTPVCPVMPTACCCHCLTFEMVTIWQKKKRHFLDTSDFYRHLDKVQVKTEVTARCHPFSLTVPRPMARPRGKCLSLPICRPHGQGVPFSCRQSLYLNSTVAGTDFQEKQRSGPPDKRPDFHMGYWVDSGLHGGHSCHGIITDGDCLSVHGGSH